MTLEPLLWPCCCISGRFLLEYIIATQSHPRETGTSFESDHNRPIVPILNHFEAKFAVRCSKTVSAAKFTARCSRTRHLDAAGETPARGSTAAPERKPRVRDQTPSLAGSSNNGFCVQIPGGKRRNPSVFSLEYQSKNRRFEPAVGVGPRERGSQAWMLAWYAARGGSGGDP